jgi:hypothetical protein
MEGGAMAQNNSRLADAVTNLAEAVLIDLPLFAIGRSFDRSFSDDLHHTAWKAYDASVAISIDLTNRMYRSRRFGRVSGRALDVSLKAHRLAEAASGALFAALWPMVGLPTASEVRRLSDKIDSLRQQLRPPEPRFEVSHPLRFDKALPPDNVGEMLRLSPTIEAIAPAVKRYISH